MIAAVGRVERDELRSRFGVVDGDAAPTGHLSGQRVAETFAGDTTTQHWKNDFFHDVRRALEPRISILVKAFSQSFIRSAWESNYFCDGSVQ